MESARSLSMSCLVCIISEVGRSMAPARAKAPYLESNATGTRRWWWWFPELRVSHHLFSHRKRSDSVLQEGALPPHLDSQRSKWFETKERRELIWIGCYLCCWFQYSKRKIRWVLAYLCLREHERVGWTGESSSEAGSLLLKETLLCQ